jgi:hypothetical protein
MKRAITGLVFAATIASAVRPAHAVDAEAGTVSANIVALQSGARASAMGGAFTAVADDLNAVYYNIAGLGFFPSSEVQANQSSGIAELELSDLSVAIPLGDVTASNVRRLGVIVFNIGTLDYGSETALNASGNPIGGLEATDNTLAFGWGKAFGERFAIGGLARSYKAKIFGQDESGTVIDAGLLLRVVPGYLNLGLAGSEVGNDVPTEYRGGVSIMPAGEALILSGEVGTAEDRSSIVRAGIELHPVSVFALRAGYDSSFDAGSGISFGAGIQLLDLEVGFFPIDRVTLDYAYTPADDLEAMHRFSLGARIGTQ